MKILGKRILGSDLRFTFEVEGDEVSTADAMNIKQLDAAVCNTPNGNGTTLADIVHLLGRIASGGEVKIAVEEVES